MCSYKQGCKLYDQTQLVFVDLFTFFWIDRVGKSREFLKMDADMVKDLTSSAESSRQKHKQINTNIT